MTNDRGKSPFDLYAEVWCRESIDFMEKRRKGDGISMRELASFLQRDVVTLRRWKELRTFPPLPDFLDWLDYLDLCVDMVEDGAEGETWPAWKAYAVKVPRRYMTAGIYEVRRCAVLFAVRRDELGWSVEKLAAELRMSPCTLSLIESRARLPALPRAIGHARSMYLTPRLVEKRRLPP